LRKRKLPEQVECLVVGMALFRETSVAEVVSLDLALQIRRHSGAPHVHVAAGARLSPRSPR
jgi:hypothetical protein